MGTEVMNVFDLSLIESETLTVRGREFILYEISSDVWHDHVAVFQDEEEMKKRGDREKERQTLNWMQRLVACALLSPDANVAKALPDVLNQVKRFPGKVLSPLYKTACELNGLPSGNSRGADSTSG